MTPFFLYTYELEPPTSDEPFTLYTTLAAKDLIDVVKEMIYQGTPVTHKNLISVINTCGKLMSNETIMAFTKEEYDLVPKTKVLANTNPKLN